MYVTFSDATQKAQKINVSVQVGSQSDASKFAIFKTSRTDEKSAFHRASLSFLISFTEGGEKDVSLKCQGKYCH